MLAFREHDYQEIATTRQFVIILKTVQSNIPLALTNIGTQDVQELFFCDLKAPGGCSTRWTHKGNSFMCTGVPDSSQCHYKV